VHFYGPSVHDDGPAGRVYDRRLARRLSGYVGPYRRYVALAVFLLLLASAVQLAGPWLTKVAIDRYIQEGDLHGLTRIGLLYLAVLLVGFALQYCQVYLTQLIGQRVMHQIRTDLFSHLQTLSMKFFDHNPVGRLMARVNNDVQALSDLFGHGVVMIFGDLFILIGIMIAMLAMNWRLAVVTFVAIPLLFAAAWAFRRYVRIAYRAIRTQVGRMNSFLQEHVVGMKIVQLFGREEESFHSFREINREHFRVQVQAVFYHAIFFPAVELIGALAIGLIIWYGGSKILTGALTFGAMVAFIQYVERFFRPIRDLMERFNVLQSSMAASERIFHLLDTEPEIADPADIVRLEPVRGEIEFKNVWFSYNGGNGWALRDVSFHIRPGERVALVGETGAGKSSIMNLLTRMYSPDQGSILLDGVDIRQLAQEDIHRHIGIVLQDVVLFSRSVMDNIRLGNPDAPGDDLREAARQANASAFIDRLPERYDTQIREGGSLLSVGQRQLLAFTRALAYDPQVLILDEATSNVDPETDQTIQAALKRLLKGRTSIIIAHRLSTIQAADRILVFHHGQLRESGSHQELMKRGGIYSCLYDLQYVADEATSEHRPDTP
jgi:ATP-binding cassette subfamily B protein